MRIAVFVALFLLAHCVPTRKASDKAGAQSSQSCNMVSDSTCYQTPGSQSNLESICKQNSGQIQASCPQANLKAKCTTRNKNGVDILVYYYAPRYGDDQDLIKSNCDSIGPGGRVEIVQGSTLPNASNSNATNGSVTVSPNSISGWRPTVANAISDSQSFSISLGTSSSSNTMDDRVTFYFDLRLNGGQPPRIGQTYSVQDISYNIEAFFTWKILFLSSKFNDPSNSTYTTRPAQLTLREFSSQQGGRISGDFQITLGSGPLSGSFITYQH